MFESEDTLDIVHDIAKTPFVGSCDEFVCEDFPTLGFDDSVLPNPLDHSHSSPIRSLPSVSLEHYIDVPTNNPMICYANVDLGYEGNMFHVLGGNTDNFVSLGYFGGYNPSNDPYCMHLVAKPRKITWNTFLDFSLDFSMAFDFLKRAMTLFATIILILSYCHACKSHVVSFDKLLRALTTSNLMSQVLSSRWTGQCSMCPGYQEALA